MTDTPRYLLIIVGMVAATYVSRFPVLFLAGRRELPLRLAALLRYVPPAVLISITAPAVLYSDGSLSVSLTNEYLIAAMATTLTAWLTKRMLLAIIVGMLTLWSWRLLLVALAS